MGKKAAVKGLKSLVIVESPAKARTIGKFLGNGYTVEASIGHIRDLPQGAKEIPEEYKGEDWAYLGVNVDQDFEPVYVIPADKKKQVRKLKAALKDAKDLYLATDEDREGEAISWHLCEVLKPKVPVHRLVFHEITEEAIREALEHPARDRRRPGPGPGNAPDHRPAVRLRSLAAVVAEDPAAAFGRPRAERGRAADRRARTAADGLSYRPRTGTCWARSPRPAARRSRPSWSRSTAARFPPAAISIRPPGKLKDPALLLLDEQQAGRAGRAAARRPSSA